MSYIKSDNVDLSAYLSDSFETVNKNISSYPYVLNYEGSNISSIVYSLGGGFIIIKSLTYTDNKLTQVVLSGLVPNAVNNKTKTLGYSGNNLINVNYS